jgi:hypothetical protein
LTRKPHEILPEFSGRFEPFLIAPIPTHGWGTAMVSRSWLKWGLLICVGMLAKAVALQAEPSLSLWLKDTLYYVETGSAATAVAIVLALIATA